ncbi:OprO/OprP family phosphate-selective porin [Pseudoroseomonas sp. WGS1072]|uniref:OprO/OprP family phosphate-selective porin n=1 Tax=Roseomonas sp. WGS1072 TaxID=3366816 RepID=UPI003BF2428D
MILRSLAVGALTVLVCGQTAAQTSASSDSLSWSGIRPHFSLADGNFTLSPVGRLDLHGGSYFGQPDSLPDRFASGVNMRRGRVGLRGTALKDYAYNFTWEFGPSTPQEPPRGGRIFELSLAYKGLEGANFQIGAWTLPHTLAYASSSSEMLFIERPSITAMATSVASGDTRFAAGAEFFNKRVYGSAFATQGVASTPYDNDQRGVVGRFAWLALNGDVKMQVGFNGAYQAQPGSNTSATQRFRDYPELRLNSFRYVDTRSIPADASWAIGPELSGLVGKMYYAAEYQQIGVDALDGTNRSFGGWYVNVSYPLLGEPRRRADSNATWRRGRAHSLDFRGENWGALELAGGYSTVDLNDGPVHGGRQSIWSTALNWYPTDQLKLTAQYQNGSLGLPGPDRDFQSIAFSLIFSL